MNGVIFLDADGVFLSYDGVNKTALARIKRLCIETNSQIVLTSDLRRPCAGNDHWKMEQALVEAGLWSIVFLHRNYKTPYNGGGEGIRWTEVRDWLKRNGDEIDGYVILEDTFSHFEKAPQEMRHRIVWCNNRHGFVEELYERARDTILTQYNHG